MSGGGSSSGNNQANFTASQMNKSGNTGGQREHLLLGAGPEIHPPLINFTDMKTEMKEFAFEKAQMAFSRMRGWGG